MQLVHRRAVAPCEWLIYELAHGLLHSETRPASREVAEVEVESVAFVVCDAIGLHTGEYSFPYVSRWAKGSSELVKETAERAIVCAKQILTTLEVPGALEQASLVVPGSRSRRDLMLTVPPNRLRF
jgi:hypothetical protein